MPCRDELWRRLKDGVLVRIENLRLRGTVVEYTDLARTQGLERELWLFLKTYVLHRPITVTFTSPVTDRVLTYSLR